MEGETEAVRLTITPSCPTGPGSPTSPSSPCQQSCIFSTIKTRCAHTNTHAGQLPMGSTNLLSNRPGFTNATRHSRLALWQKRDEAAWIEMPPNKNLLEISPLLFPQKKLKLGQDYQSTEKKSIHTWILFHLVTVRCTCARIPLCTCVRVSVFGVAHNYKASPVRCYPHIASQPIYHVVF